MMIPIITIRCLHRSECRLSVHLIAKNTFLANIPNLLRTEIGLDVNEYRQTPTDVPDLCRVELCTNKTYTL